MVYSLQLALIKIVIVWDGCIGCISDELQNPGEAQVKSWTGQHWSNLLVENYGRRPFLLNLLYTD